MNAELALKVLNKIKANPQTWNQEFWATRSMCGTVYCFAGHVVLEVYPTATPCLCEDQIRTGQFTVDGGRRMDYSEEAAKLLGISDEDAAELFNSMNSLKDIEDYINGLS